MKIPPIIPTDKPRWQKPRAYMSIRYNEHTVVMSDGRRATLPAEEAWALHPAVNGGLEV